MFTDSNTSCSVTEKMVITVNNAPEVSLTPYDSICESYGAYLLSATPAKGTWTGSGVEKTNDWYFNPALVSIINQEVFDLTYTFTDSNNCSDNGIFRLTVFEDKMVDAGNHDSICMMEGKVWLQASPEGGNWTGNGLEGNYFNPMVAGSGYHLLKYTFENGLCSSTDSIILYVATVPDSAITRSADSLFVTSGMTYYQWYLNGNAISGENKSFVVMSQQGVYFAEFIDPFGCEYKSKSFDFTGISATNESLISVYPNPVSKLLFIKGNQSTVHVKITDINGKEYIQMVKENGEFTIDLSAFASGVYYLTLQSNDFKKQYKIVKQ